MYYKFQVRYSFTFLCFQFCVSWAVRGFITCPTSVQQKWKLKYLHFYISLHNAFNRETKTFPQVSKITLFSPLPKFPPPGSTQINGFVKNPFSSKVLCVYCRIQILYLQNLFREKTKFLQFSSLLGQSLRNQTCW